MKTVAIGLIVSLSAFILGCAQDEVINAPTDVLSAEFSKPEPSNSQTIMLSGVVLDPSGFNQLCSVAGEITYSIIFGTDPSQTGCQVTSLSLDVEGSVIQGEGNKEVWPFGSSSELAVCLGNDVNSLEQVYTLVGREDNVALHILLQYDGNQFEVGSMWLEQPIAPSPDQEL